MLIQKGLRRGTNRVEQAACAMTPEKHFHEQSESHADEVTIRGLVTPAEWDETGKVTGIAISGFNEEEYAIEGDPKGRELLSLLRKEVEVKGTVEWGGENRVIRISRYDLIRE
jgi:hypothetical protein